MTVASDFDTLSSRSTLPIFTQTWYMDDGISKGFLDNGNRTKVRLSLPKRPKDGTVKYGHILQEPQALVDHFEGKRQREDMDKLVLSAKTEPLIRPMLVIEQTIVRSKTWNTILELGSEMLPECGLLLHMPYASQAPMAAARLMDRGLAPTFVSVPSTTGGGALFWWSYTAEFASRLTRSGPVSYRTLWTMMTRMMQGAVQSIGLAGFLPTGNAAEQSWSVELPARSLKEPPMLWATGKPMGAAEALRYTSRETELIEEYVDFCTAMGFDPLSGESQNLPRTTDKIESMSWAAILQPLGWTPTGVRVDREGADVTSWAPLGSSINHLVTTNDRANPLRTSIKLLRPQPGSLLQYAWDYGITLNKTNTLAVLYEGGNLARTLRALS